jgi:hypothetical protein
VYTPPASGSHAATPEAACSSTSREIEPSGIMTDTDSPLRYVTVAPSSADTTAYGDPEVSILATALVDVYKASSACDTVADITAR